MWCDVLDDVFAANDLEIEAPTAIDARLPFIPGFAVLLGAKGRVV